LATNLRNEDRLCLIADDGEPTLREPRIICSLGLFEESPDDSSLG
jgi:hypothetical protein